MTIILIAVVLFVASWDVLWWLGGITPVSPRRLREHMDSSSEKPILVDVRTAREYELFHIEASKSYPRLLIHPGDLPEKEVERPIVVICLSGHRSPLAAYRLKQRGFRKVSYLTWGMIAWVVSGGRVVRGN